MIVTEDVEKIQAFCLHYLDPWDIPGRFVEVRVLAVDDDQGALQFELLFVADKALRSDLGEVETFNDQ